MFAAWQMIFGIAALLVLGLVVEGNPVCFHSTGMVLFRLLFLAVFGSALTFLLLYRLMARLTVAFRPGAVMLGWLFGSEISAVTSLWACRPWMMKYPRCACSRTFRPEKSFVEIMPTAEGSAIPCTLRPPFCSLFRIAVATSHKSIFKRRLSKRQSQ